MTKTSEIMTMLKNEITKNITTILKNENLTRLQEALLLEELALSIRKRCKLEYHSAPPEVLKPFGLILHLLVVENFPIATKLFKQQIRANITGGVTEGGTTQKVDRMIAKLVKAGVIETYSAGVDSLYYLKISSESV